MSEPDFPIGVDEELVSGLESLHEDIYFVTLDFYLAMGRNAPGRPRLAAPGKVFPIIHPERRGQAGTARVLYAANAAPRARVEITYKEKGAAKPTTVTRDLTPVNVGDPAVRRAVLVGNKISPGNPSTKSDGTVVRTRDWPKQQSHLLKSIDASRPVIVAASGAPALTWGQVVRARVQMAERDVQGLRSADVEAAAYLQRFTAQLNPERAPRSRLELLSDYAASDLASADFPVELRNSYDLATIRHWLEKFLFRLDRKSVV